MDREVAKFRAAVERLGLGGVGCRYPEDLKSWAVSYWSRASGEGLSRADAAAELGITEETLGRWASSRSATETSPKAPLYEVVVGEPAATGTLTLVSPSGYRIEGLSIAELSALLGAVG